MVARLEPTRPFTLAAAAEAGVTEKVLVGPQYRRIFRGVYIGAQVVLDPQLRAEAALLVYGGEAAASHASAARLYGLPIPTIPEEHVTVRDAACRRRRVGVVCHCLPAHRSTVEDGLRRSTPEQLFLEMGVLLSLVDHVALGDAMVRRGLSTPEQLRAFVGDAAGGRGVDRSRRAASYVRRGVDSPMETRLRMLFLLAGLPEPEINYRLRDVRGEPLRSYDMCWPEAMTVAEYDGRQHIEREENWASDLTRREASDNDGWRMLVFIAADIFKTPARTVDRMWRVPRQRRLPGLPKRPRDDWQPHFPGW